MVLYNKTDLPCVVTQDGESETLKGQEQAMPNVVSRLLYAHAKFSFTSEQMTV